MTERLSEKLRRLEPEEASFDEIMKRAVEEIIPNRWSLEARMREGPIRLYLGIDPTSPHLHLGHTVPLRKLRQFQEMGHEVFLLFGSFTGMIGDPTDKAADRVQLTPEQIAANVATYTQQAGRILDLSENIPNPVKVVYNHEWLGRMGFAEVVELMSHFSVQQLLERRSFQERMTKGSPVWMHELAYCLMQAEDADYLNVDLEIGGKDQTWNMIKGAELMWRRRQKEKWVMALKLIEDPSGKKMGKTEGTLVNILDWPEWKYEGIMKLPDSTIALGFEALTSVPMEQVYIVREVLYDGSVHPMKLKEALAYRVVAELDGVEAAEYAEEEFNRVIRHDQEQRRLKEISVESGQRLDQVLVTCGLAENNQEALLRISQGSVFLDGQKIRAGRDEIAGETHSSFVFDKPRSLLQIGKKTISKARVILTE